MTEAVLETKPEVKPAIRSTTTVITSDTAEAFYNEKLGVPKPAETNESEVAPPATDETEDQAAEVVKREAKGNSEISERFSKVTRQRKEALAAAEAAKEEARVAREAREAAERVAAELKAKYEPPKTDPLGPEPQPDQFSDPKEYGAALKEWTGEKLERDRVQREAEERQAKEQQERATSWKARQDEARKGITDYDAKINGSSVVVSDDVRDAIIESEVGPQLLYHLATNPEVADKLGKLSPASALREIGRIEAKLSDKAPVDAPKTPVAEISKAPAPITPLKGANAPVEPPLDSNGVFHGSYEQWKEARKSGKIK